MTICTYNGFLFTCIVLLVICWCSSIRAQSCVVNGVDVSGLVLSNGVQVCFSVTGTCCSGAYSSSYTVNFPLCGSVPSTACGSQSGTVTQIGPNNAGVYTGNWISTSYNSQPALSVSFTGGAVCTIGTNQVARSSTVYIMCGSSSNTASEPSTCVYQILLYTLDTNICNGLRPSSMPSSMPTLLPTTRPSPFPTLFPTSLPSIVPTVNPTSRPTASPTTYHPTAVPSTSPTAYPTTYPTKFPTVQPTTLSPSVSPTTSPTCAVSLCTAGQFSTNTSVCSICPAGQYTSQLDQSSCSLCPAGLYNNIYTQGSTSMCVPCAAGSYANAGVGATACLPCPAGSFSYLGATVCTLCPAGLFSPSIGHTNCMPCLPGTFAGSGASMCQSCLVHTGSAAFANNCTSL